MKIIPSFIPRTSCSIAFVGETPGEQEERLGTPFVGASGKELIQMCLEANIPWAQCYRGNAIAIRPPMNNLEAFFCAKADLPPDYPEPQIQHNKYLDPKYLPLVENMRKEILDLKPNVIVALGNTAMWALTGLYDINKHRGVIYETPYGKVLPTIHPAAILRKWNDRVVAIADLEKAKYESEFPEVRRPERHLLIEPTLDDVFQFGRDYLDGNGILSFDIETKGGQITCIAFAATPTEAICIPLYDRTKEDGCYWSLDDERVVWRWVRDQLYRHGVRRLAQNGLYDIQYLARQGIKVRHLEEDTMLMHHAMFPEMKKGLGFLASVYTNELSWKGMAKDLGKDK